MNFREDSETSHMDRELIVQLVISRFSFRTTGGHDEALFQQGGGQLI